MRYIRFLKPPKIKGTTISCLITITSDLGESFFPEQVNLTGALQAALPNGDIYTSKALKWEPQMRSLPLEFSIKDCTIDWPAKVHVSIRNAPDLDLLASQGSGFELPNIISAWSDVLDPISSISQTGRVVERRFNSLDDRVISMWEETGESIARHLWYTSPNRYFIHILPVLIPHRDAGIALSAHLGRLIVFEEEGLPLIERLIGATAQKPLNVIELGAGCGIVGISLAQFTEHCEVILTDMPEAKDIAQRNIKGMLPANESKVIFQPLNWDEPLPSGIDNKQFDLILVADCTYNPDSSPALVNTFSALVERSPKAVVLVAMKIRHDAELVFFDLMKEAGFIIDGEICLPLPEMLGEQEHVEVYVYYHNTRPSSV
jgi:predicted nicotinamide N-methyase